MVDFGLLKNMRQFLLNSKNFSEKVSGIFTTPLPKTSFPYLTLEWEKALQQRDRACVTVVLKLWSDAPGLKEINRLGGILKKILATSPLPLPLESHQESVQLKLEEERLKCDAKGALCFCLTYQAFIKEKR